MIPFLVAIAVLVPLAAWQWRRADRLSQEAEAVARGLRARGLKAETLGAPTPHIPAFDRRGTLPGCTLWAAAALSGVAGVLHELDAAGATAATTTLFVILGLAWILAIGPERVRLRVETPTPVRVRRHPTRPSSGQPTRQGATGDPGFDAALLATGHPVLVAATLGPSARSWLVALHAGDADEPLVETLRADAVLGADPRPLEEATERALAHADAFDPAAAASLRHRVLDDPVPTVRAQALDAALDAADAGTATFELPDVDALTAEVLTRAGFDPDAPDDLTRAAQAATGDAAPIAAFHRLAEHDGAWVGPILQAIPTPYGSAWERSLLRARRRFHARRRPHLEAAAGRLSFAEDPREGALSLADDPTGQLGPADPPATTRPAGGRFDR